MEEIIHVLPKELASRVAAGEVVQRPASALKELIENSIDAQAKHIKIIVENAGITSLSVLDDGIGMGAVDARMCFASHATSKIHRDEDMQRLDTYGFRGEALSALAAVAEVELKTRTAEQDTGTLVQIAGGEIQRQGHVQMPQGSQFQVRNLFFNIPARRKFLASPATELRHLHHVFEQAALSHPNIAFSLHISSKDTTEPKERNLPATDKLMQRIIDLLGSGYAKMLLPISLNHSALGLKGYVGKPQAARKKSGNQWLFVNGRYVKSRGLNYAVFRGYERFLNGSEYPFYLINLEVDPREIDVNIHPAKTEVRFENEQLLCSLVTAAVKKALANHPMSGNIDYALDANFFRRVQQDTSSSTSPSKPSAVPSKHMPLSQLPAGKREDNTKKEPSWQTPSVKLPPTPNPLPLPLETDAEKETLDLLPSPPKPQFISSKERKHQKPVLLDEKEPPPLAEAQKDSTQQHPYPPFMLHGAYICKPLMKGRLLVVDYKRANERILYERFLSQESKASASAQQLLFEERLVFSDIECTLLHDAKDLLAKQGFHYKAGEQEIIVKSLPLWVAGVRLASLFESILESLQEEFQPDIQAKQKALWRLMAARLSAYQSPLSSAESMIGFIEQLFACNTHTYTPAGKTIFQYLESNVLDQLFVEKKIKDRPSRLSS